MSSIPTNSSLWFFTRSLAFSIILSAISGLNSGSKISIPYSSIMKLIVSFLSLNFILALTIFIMSLLLSVIFITD